MKIRYFIIIILLIISVPCWVTAENEVQRPGKHILLLHLDGVRSDLLKEMMASHQLPNLERIYEKSRTSFDVSTVDKSETMKVILSYLSSHIDLEVVGWWQFNRDEFRFRNFWLDPVEVLNYALGLEFPRFPTLFDFLNDKSENIVAGFHLHRRGVSFRNYARAYSEGIDAVFNDTYLKQALATTNQTIAILNHNIDEGRSEGYKVPIMTTMLLASVDEFIHVDGVFTTDPKASKGEYCFSRKEAREREKDPIEPVFQAIEGNIGSSRGSQISAEYSRYFTKIEWTGFTERQPAKLCIKLPKLMGFSDPLVTEKTTLGKETSHYAAPRPVIAMMFIDIQLGRLVENLKRDGLDEKTLFVVFGDHGMGDTKRMMADPKSRFFNPDINRGSLPVTFIASLNNQLGLHTAAYGDAVTDGMLMGIDDASMPAVLVYPHKYRDWQNLEIREKVKDAEVWAGKFFEHAKQILTEGVKANYANKHSFLYFFFEMMINVKIGDKVQEKLDQYKNRIIDELAKLYLRGDHQYCMAEKEALQKFYDAHIRLVYGGGARNNAEIFLPGGKEGAYRWHQRPTYEEIIHFKPEGSQKTVLETLKENPGVGLIFVRKNNGDINSRKKINGKMEIEVVDRFNNKGLITVYKHAVSGQLRYSYRLLTMNDPLGYVKHDTILPQKGTYNDWNDLSVKEKHYYHNAVAGMGSILYSANPAIGDILVMRSQGWNFGDNSGGHGGIHREEKITFAMVAGPGVTAGKLMSRNEEGAITNTTLLDISPTILHWLGYGSKALTRFCRVGFKEYLCRWISAQKNEIVNNYSDMDDIKKALEKASSAPVDLSGFTPAIRGLLDFMPDELPEDLPDYGECQEDGNQMILY